MRNRVKRLLASDDKYKKSDYSLMARIWWDDLKVLHYGNATEVTAIEFLEHLVDGDLTKWETATRIRRKLQSKFKQLRDEETYKGRKVEETRWRDRFSPASMVYESDLDLSGLKFKVHSSNPVAKVNIESLLNNYIRFLRNE